tara:strand:+ start:477 stop:1388 length:912 start_codon:yes stop_codon:yes gene_type:complete
MKKTYIIEDDYTNTRFDKWLKSKFQGIPQSLIEKHIRKKNIKINNQKIKSSYKLKKNDEIIIRNLFYKPSKLTNEKYFYKGSKKEFTSLSKMFIEDNENFVVLNKPSGISVQQGTKSKRNIIDILKGTDQFKNLSPYPVHRIDKETTGILVVAKNRKYAQIFTYLFRARKIYKTYLGIVVGKFNNNKGTLTDELFYYEKNKKISTKAITHYSVLDSNNNYSFIKLNPETGRKHQIRKQLLIHGCPILGDSKYRISLNKKNKKEFLMLHAYKINFSINNTKYSFFAEPPTEFKKNLKEKYLKNF